MAMTNSERSRKHNETWNTTDEKHCINESLLAKRSAPEKLEYLRKYKKAMNNRSDWTGINRDIIERYVWELTYKYEDHADG
ncbi:MAG: hypothetical protein GY861_24220 [bacterium]|nr:hypothetical protein [bacterium]